jgi:hypothetical protein
MSRPIEERYQSAMKGLSELGSLTREYGRFSRDAVGLGHVLGGGLVFLSAYILERRIHFGLLGRLLLGAAPFGWVIGKEWLRQNYYQFTGRVIQPRRRGESLVLLILTSMVALINLIVTGFVIYSLLGSFSWWLALSSLVYIAMLLAMPLVVWRYLRAPYEFVVGIFLFTLSAILLSGSPLAVSGRVVIAYLLTLPAEVVALAMILVGFVEHMEFLKLRRKLRPQKEAA